MKPAAPPEARVLRRRGPAAPPAWLLRFALVALSLAGLWLVLNEADPASWVVGVPSALLGAWLACLLPAPARPALSPGGALRFAPFFLRQSLVGGWDVASRALRPGPPLAPAFLSYATRLPPGPARVFFFNTVTLLPGSLIAEVAGDRVLVHVVDGQGSPQEGIRDLERRVARLFARGSAPT